jgi:hypothetical protein
LVTNNSLVTNSSLGLKESLELENRILQYQKPKKIRYEYVPYEQRLCSVWMLEYVAARPERNEIV